METDLRARLLAAAPVAALVATRVDWMNRPQGTGLPAVTLQIISPGRRYSHEGANTLSGPRVQVDCWGKTYKEVENLAAAVVAAVEPPATQGTTRFLHSFVIGERDVPPESLAGGVTAYRRIIDFTVWNQPA